MPLAVFGIDNDGLNLVVNLLVLFAVVVWLALVYWTYTDAQRRIEDPVLVACATAAALFPYIGTVVYTIVRPPEYREDVHERDLEIRAAEARLHQIENHLCPYCDFEVEPAFLRCPSCLRRLKEPCVSCSKPLNPRWKICPYCEAEVVQAPPPRSTRRGSERSERPDRVERSERSAGPPPSSRDRERDKDRDRDKDRSGDRDRSRRRASLG